ncbi:MAG: L,D-transpeptidase [Planctomycetales bacterium]|nr:L,D-transpeptidase [Planctomycetales bacterium]
MSIATSPVFANSHEKRLAELQAYAEMYGPLPNEQFPIPAVDLSKIDPIYLRKFGDYRTDEPPGTVIVDTAQRVLFLTLPEGKAIRYGVGIGRDGFSWSGRAIINHKRAWPTWTPPSEMIERQPELEEWRFGMPPSLENPLGARALYIFQDGRDTLYRLHGTSQPESIGHAVSSGCVRLLHHDVIDLYNRVPDKSPIVVL